MNRYSILDDINEIADFLESSRKGDLNSMKEAKRGSNIDINSVSVTGQTALMFASIGSVAPANNPATPAEITEWLLSQGADQTLVDQTGYKAIHHAARNGQKDVVEILINADRSLIESDVGGWRPLHFAVSNNDYDLADLLIRNGADVNAEIDYEGRKYRVADLVEHYIPLQEDRKAMSELILTASKVAAQILGEGLSSPSATRLIEDRSQGAKLGRK
jgi:ankyrin repeat protein